MIIAIGKKSKNIMDRMKNQVESIKQMQKGSVYELNYIDGTTITIKRIQ